MLGVDTESEVGHDVLEFDGTRGFDYTDTSWLRMVHVYRMLRALPVGPEDAFLDLGCGKGRTLLVASRFPFGRLIGVDLSPSLLAIAAANAERIGELSPGVRIELVESDAGLYEIPDDVTTIMLFDPFPDRVVEQVLDHLMASVRRHPRKVRIIYVADPSKDAPTRRGFRMVRRAGKVALFVYDVSVTSDAGATERSASTGSS